MSLNTWLSSDYNRLRLLIVALAVGMAVALWFDLGETLRNLPHVVVYLITIIWVVLSVKLGFRLGRLKQGGIETKADDTVKAVAGAQMGLLAFMLAFVFNLCMSRYDTRKNLYIDQVNAIENCYRRANLLPDRYRTVVQAELIKYTELRIGVINHAEGIPDMIKRSDGIHVILWGVLVRMQKDDQVTSTIHSLFASALSNLVDVHNKRTSVGFIYHLATPLWVALYLLVAAGMSGMGYLAGMTSRMNWSLVLMLSFSFSVVVIIISDLDRSGSGRSFIEFNQQAMIDLKARLHQP